MMTQHKTLNARLEDLYFFRGFGTVLPRNPIYLSLSRGVRSLSPSLDPNMLKVMGEKLLLIILSNKSFTVNSEIFARILFSRKALKHICDAQSSRLRHD